MKRKRLGVPSRKSLNNLYLENSVRNALAAFNSSFDWTITAAIGRYTRLEKVRKERKDDRQNRYKGVD